MINSVSNPLKAEQFLEAVKTSLAPAKGTYIYQACIRNYLEKTSPDDPSGYVRWLRRLLPYLSKQYSLAGNKVLDFGCGTGELTVLMTLLGFAATGMDVHAKDIRLAKILANENGFSENIFICGEEGKSLPFENNSFDVITMISVLEHMTDGALKRLVPELARICRGVLFLQVPNKLRISDDHTGLKFVPWMPHWLAKRYLEVRGSRYTYHISSSGSWDVYYRNLDQTISYFETYFDHAFCPPDCSFPEPSDQDLLIRIGKTVNISSRKLFIGLPLPWRRVRMRFGYPKEAYYPYLNLIFRKRT